ncbi:PAS domain S-box protein [Chitinispirillales bacterium ANBcel5]|uniref:PAS domain S-box protein n=1 Tax=Cellulosispirillum alkaliphilum TaxID=3039283 RepID=UPI002A561658|nr:PAS domain S-box protein [Chitinispirillales bacterium ANBcel5]
MADPGRIESLYFDRGSIDALWEPLLILDENFQVQIANTSFLTTFKLSRAAVEEKSLFDIGLGQWCTPDLVKNLRLMVKEQLALKDLRIRHHFPMIGERVIGVNAQIMKKGGASKQYLMLSMRDVTKEPQEPRQSELLFRKFVEEIHSIIISFDRSGCITYFNNFSETLFGYSREEVVGKPFVGTIIPTIDSNGRDNSKVCEQMFHEPEKYYAYESEGVRKDGSRLSITWNSRALRDCSGRVIEIIIDGNDITALKRERKEAEENASILKAVLEFIPDGIMVIDSQRVVKRASKKMGELLNVPVEQIVDTSDAGRLEAFNITWPDGGHLSGGQELPLVKSVTTGQSYTDYELVFKTNGKQKYLSVNSAAIKNSAGDIVGAVGVWHDQTGQKRLMKEYDRQRFFLQTLIDSIPVMITVYDPSAKQFTVNKTFERITGWTQQQVRKSDLFELIYPDPEYRKRVQKIMCSPKPEFSDYAMVSKDGEVIESSWANIALPDGRYVGVGVDIRERKRAERDLREIKERYQLVNLATNDIIWDWDLITDYFYWNERVEEALGKKRNEMAPTAKSWYDHIDPQNRERVVGSIRKVIAEGERFWTSEYGFGPFGGPYRLYLDRGYIARDKDGRAYRMIGSMLDLTERKRAAEEIRVKEERYKTLFTTIDEGFCILKMVFDERGEGVDYIFLETNPAFERHTGLVNAAGKRARDMVPHLEKVWPKVYGKVAQTGERQRFIQGSKAMGRWFEVEAFRVGRPDEGKVALLFNDISERKKYEDQIQRRTHELAAANNDLESFSYSVSHDLRNPLSVIGSFSAILMEDYAEVLDEEGRDLLHRIEESVKKMQLLISDMLNLSRIGRQELRIEKLNVSEIVTAILEELRSLDQERKTEFLIEKNVWVQADPRLLYVALENLLRNAWKFTAKKELSRIEFGTTENDAKVYYIRDNGAGFEGQFSKRIFEPFTRVHAQREFGGTGIGLSIVKRVVSRHGGDVWAEGKKAQGATFYFTLRSNSSDT